MKHLCLIALCISSPAAAWEFSPSPICTLSKDVPDGAMVVTHDPRADLPYAIAVTRTEGWDDGTVFAILFDGPTPFPITTNRHAVDGTTLAVRDRGFGNVLRGIEDGTEAIASVGDSTLAVSLDGADRAVQQFKACTEGGFV